MCFKMIHVTLFSESVIDRVAGLGGEDKGLMVNDDLEVTSFGEGHEVSNGWSMATASSSRPKAL